MMMIMMFKSAHDIHLSLCTYGNLNPRREATSNCFGQLACASVFLQVLVTLADKVSHGENLGLFAHCSRIRLVELSSPGEIPNNFYWLVMFRVNRGSRQYFPEPSKLGPD